MIRMLMICAFVLAPAGTALRSGDQPSQRDGEIAAVHRAGEIVRTRFALVARTRSCRSWDNLYGYNLLLEHITDEQRTILRAAEWDGRRQGSADGVIAAPQTDCAAEAKKLDDADNQLLILAEHAAVAR